MANGNPFRPSFGASPPVLAGRTEVLDALAEALDSGADHPDFTSLLVGVRGAVCSKGDRINSVHREPVAEFKRQLELRQTGQIDVLDSDVPVSSNGDTGGWLVIDGTGKTCAGIIAALTEHIDSDGESFVEVLIPDVLNTYDVIVWAEKRNHSILTQRNDDAGFVRMLIKP